MENKNKYILLCLEERNGDYEYQHKSVHTLPDGRESTAERFCKNYLKDFYGGGGKSENGGYFFNDWEVFVEVSSWKFVTEEHYNVLNKYL